MMTDISENYTRMKHYFRLYMEEYHEFSSLSYSDINEIFDQMLEHVIHIAETYLGDDEEDGT